AGVRAAGHRPADDQLDLPARLPDRPGGDARLLNHGRARVPPHGRRARAARPAGPVRLMGAAAEAFAEAAVIEHRSGFRRRWYRTPSFVAGASILGTIVLLAVLAPVASWHDPIQQNLLQILQSPSWSHPLGTDELGRDVWA